MWKRLGVNLKRNTMANWVVLTAEPYLKPFSDAFLAELLRQAVFHADETVLQVNKEPGRDAHNTEAVPPDHALAPPAFSIRLAFIHRFSSL